MDRRKSPSRAGFTLVEVLVAILIIASLVAILLPAVRGAYRRAQDAQVTAELNNLATALASFKTAYGDYPPSRIILCETGYSTDPTVNANASLLYANTMIAGPDTTNDSDITMAQLTQRTLLYLRRFWPRVNFNAAFDFNNKNGTGDGAYILSGSECLTFFLGGQPLNDGNGTIIGVSGFSKLPTNPFLPTNPLNSASSNRTVPNYEFNAGRLVDLDHDGIPSYIDPLDTSQQNRRSYAYFCSYGTNSYDPNDVNGLGKYFDSTSTTANSSGDFEEEDDGSFVQRGFTVGFPISGQVLSTTVVGYTATSPTPNPYSSGTPDTSTTTGTMSWINPNSFQLLSAGQDRLWGLGGQYVQSSLGSTSKLPIVTGDVGIVHSADFTNGIRYRESDNLTNFSGGRLD